MKPSAFCFLPPAFCLLRANRRQLDDKPCPPGIICLRLYSAVVLHNNPLNNSQSQTRAGAAGRKVRLKQAWKSSGLNSMTCIGDFGNQQTAVVTVMSRNSDQPLAVLIIKCAERVINQVHKDTTKLFTVEHSRRQLGIQLRLNVHAVEPL